MAVTNKLGIWGGDPGATWSSASGGIISGFNANTLNYATKMNQAFRNATIIPYTFAQILAEASIPSVNVDIDPSTFIMNSSAISAFVTSMRSAINYYICSRAGQIASAGYAFNAGSATTANAFSTARYITLTGDITGSISSTGATGWTIDTTITDGSVTSTKLHQSAVTTAKISNYAVTANKIASSCITSAQIAQGAIDNTNLANPSITFKNGTNGTSKTASLGSTATQLSSIFGFNNTTGYVQFNSSTKAFEVVPTAMEQMMTYIPNNWLAYNPFISNLSTANYPNVSYIGVGAFAYCASLSSVHLPNVKYINRNAFEENFRLSYVSLPNVSFIGSSAFKDCLSLASINIEKISSFGWDFIYNSTKSIKVNMSRTSSISYNFLSTSGAFNPSLYMTECYIDRLKNIPDRMFLSQGNLSILASGSGLLPDDLPNNYTLNNCESIGAQAFKDCTKLGPSLRFYNCSSVGNQAFMSCTSLKEIRFGESLNILEMETFRDCINLSSIYLSKSTSCVVLVNANVFSNCVNLRDVYVPSNLIGAYQNANIWSTISNLTFKIL